MSTSDLSFANQPVFVLTADVDWASEHCVSHLIALAGAAGATPTLFATHPSPTLTEAVRAGLADVGLHPNFRPGSSHGDGVDAVIDHVRALHPEARGFRCHSYVDSTEIACKMAGAGMTWDSNLCLQFQPGLTPLRHWTGLVRYPVFWEDDVHWLTGGGWRFADYEEAFFTPGLKIVNVHPFNIALNCACQVDYERHRGAIPSLNEREARRLMRRGPGAATFLADLLAAATRRGHRFHRLSAVHDAFGASAGSPGKVKATKM